MARSTRTSMKSRLTLTHPNAAGIDIGSASHFCAVPPDRDEDPVREFKSYTVDLERLASWLEECGVDIVAMESTGYPILLLVSHSWPWGAIMPTILLTLPLCIRLSGRHVDDTQTVPYWIRIYAKIDTIPSCHVRNLMATVSGLNMKQRLRYTTCLSNMFTKGCISKPSSTTCSTRISSSLS